MSSRGKKYLEAKKKVFAAEPRQVQDAVKAVIDGAFAKFDETIGVDVVLGIDATKGDQVVRGSALLPNGTGKRCTVVAFVKAEYEAEAKAAGADYVGFEDLLIKIESGWCDFDVAVATPDVMASLTRVAKILGPRGLLPNKKTGTVSFDVAAMVTDLKKGKVSFRNDKNGGVHVAIGKLSFGLEKLETNFRALMKSLVASKPASSKGKFVRKVILSSTQGVGIAVALDDTFVY